jgi:1,4-dihydroxy-6-naphthoate synthase
MAKNKMPVLFSGIEDAVLMEKFDMGVIIHENRFTYQQKGLIKICDLGEVWEERQKAPIPLACISAKNSFNAELRNKISDLIKKSVEYAFACYPEITSYTKEHAQAMDENVMRQHIELYVNNYSIDLGEDGRKAIDQLQQVYNKLITNRAA